MSRSPADRDAFLKEACGQDEALRQEVESLLAYESASSEFLEGPAAAVVAGAPGSTQMLNRQLGPYTIVAPLGAGGMGEVYRARDSKLGRDVAIKILPAHFTADPERRARFAREARTLATLNHPHIGAIYGLEDADGVTGIVLELVEGPTLADRLERGPLKIAEALVIARQIADALNEAHEHGIIHRDLKPANIVLQGKTDLSPGDVRVKVLDFGLAKPMPVDLAAGPTAAGSGSFDGTADGRILGTPAYMSPEQARGLTVDKRTDIWAFGCVLFEMLTGRRAFDGDTVTDTLACVLEHEPDWTALPHETPEIVRKLVRRCLQKDPRKRLHDIADASLQSDDDSSPNTSGASAAIPAPVAQNRKRKQRIWVLTAALIMALFAIGLLAVAWFGLRSAHPVATDVVEFAIAPEAGSRFAGTAPEFAMSPDGRHVAFAAVRKGVQMLWVRSLSSREVRALPGTEGGRSPIWSPDSRSLAFFAARQLKRVDLSGGSPAVLCPAVFTIGGTSPAGTWSRSNMIVFGPIGGVLLQVEAQGGSARPASVLKDGDGAHRFPSFLQDGQHFLYLAQTGVTDELRIGSLTSGDQVSLGSFESHASYAAGHLFFVRGGKLMAQPFDVDTRRLTGDPTIVVENTAVDPPWQRGMFSVFRSGAPGDQPNGENDLTADVAGSGRKARSDGRRSRSVFQSQFESG